MLQHDSGELPLSPDIPLVHIIVAFFPQAVDLQSLEINNIFRMCLVAQMKYYTGIPYILLLGLLSIQSIKPIDILARKNLHPSIHPLGLHGNSLIVNHSRLYGVVCARRELVICVAVTSIGRRSPSDFIIFAISLFTART